MDRFSDHLGFQASVLGLRSRRNNILASNIANAATPNFKARDFDFARAAEKLDPTGPLTTTSKQHIPAARPVVVCATCNIACRLTRLMTAIRLSWR